MAWYGLSCKRDVKPWHGMDSLVKEVLVHVYANTGLTTAPVASFTNVVLAALTNPPA